MKSFAASVCVCVALLASACSQSAQRLVEAGNRYHDKHKFQEASILYRKAIGKDKTYAEAYYREGQNLLDQKNAAEAAKFLRRAVDLNPNNSDAEIKLSEIYLTAYAYDQKKFRTLLPEVRELTAKILQRNPKDFHGIRLQAFLYLTDKDLPKALASFEEANRLHPYSRDVVGWLAQVLTVNNQFDQAEKLSRDMIAHDKTWGPAYDFLFVQYTQRKRPAEAEAVLKERVSNDSTSDVALINYSNYLLETNRYNEAEAQMKKVLADKKSFPTGHQLMGDFYMRANRFDQAAHEYKEGISADPKNKLNYQMHLVVALVKQGVNSPEKQAEAVTLAKTLAAEHPKDAAANQLYASLLLATGAKQDVQKSLDELKKLVHTNNTDPVLHFDLARAYYAQHDLEKAQGEALEAIRLQSSMMPARILSARIYEDRGQHGKALEQSGIVLDSLPGDARAQLVRIQARIGLKEGEKVRPDLERLVKRNPNFADAVYQLAKLYMTDKEYAKAEEQFQNLWEGLGPKKQPDLRGFIGLQEVKLRQGHADQAIEAVQDLVQKNPNQPSLRYTLANFQAEAGLQMRDTNPERQSLLESAAGNYQEIAKTTANSADVYIRLGTIERALNRNGDALNSFDAAAKADPSDAEAYLNRGMVLEAMGQLDKARAAYGQTLGVDPDNVIALNNLAFLNADANQNLDQAMTYAERAKKRLPTNANISDTLGYIYLRKNLNEDAIRELQSAVDRDPKNASYRLHLAMALLKRGDKTGARREAATALRTANSDQQEKIRTFMSQIS